jgi:hypothetical protein
MSSQMPDSISSRRDTFIQRVRDQFSRDFRVIAGWLEGSLADGTADDYSDVDVHLAVRDDAWREVWEQRRALIEPLGPFLFSADLPALNGLGCVLDGPPFKVDFLFEAAAGLGARPRTSVKPLWGSAETYAAIRTGWEPSDDDVRAMLQSTVSLTMQGAAWPVRLVARQQWATLLYTELFLIETVIVPLMLVRQDRRAFHRNPLSRARNLTSEQRRVESRQTEQVVSAANLGESRSFLQAHLAILHQMCQQGKAAFDRYGLQFPEQLEDELAAFYERGWPA